MRIILLHKRQPLYFEIYTVYNIYENCGFIRYLHMFFLLITCWHTCRPACPSSARMPRFCTWVWGSVPFGRIPTASFAPTRISISSGKPYQDTPGILVNCRLVLKLPVNPVWLWLRFNSVTVVHSFLFISIPHWSYFPTNDSLPPHRSVKIIFLSLGKLYLISVVDPDPELVFIKPVYAKRLI